ncbi:hypothetical protein Ancab_036948 [Ancistrocladus abbreviatus]
MRIRKNAKLTASVIVGSSSIPPENLQAHVCQLNRSPWDVPSSSPPHSSSPFSSSYYQYGGEDSFGVNGSLDDSIAVVESKSMKLSCEYEEEKAILLDSRNFVSANRGTVKEDETEEEEDSNVHLQIEGEIGQKMLCNKTDGKGWQCRRDAKEGHTLCSHHLSQLRSYHQNQTPIPPPPFTAAVATAKKLNESTPTPPKRRGRPRKTAVAATTPNEFYYYSGFGPRWGKKRSGSNSSKAELGKIVEAEASNNKDDDNLSSAVAGASNSSSSQIDDIVMETVEELDYIDDEEEEEDIDGGDGSGIRRKRGRKPIKARSLKSLM